MGVKEHPIRRRLARSLGKLAFFAAAAGLAPGQAEASAPTEIEAIEVGQKTTLVSEALGREATLLIRLPRSYDHGSGAYPVIYVLDGSAFFEAVSAISRSLARAHAMQESIVVAIRQRHRRAELSGAKSRDFSRFLESEVIPYVEETYRAAPYRILIGHSLGGSFALSSLSGSPHLFDAYLALSPVLDRGDVPRLTELEAFFRKGRDLRKFLFLAKGNEGGGYQATIPGLRKVLEDTAPPSLAWAYREFPEDDHGSVPVPAIHYGLKTLYRGWILPEIEDLGGFDSTAELQELGGLERIRSYYSKLSERLGYAVGIPAIVFSRICWIYFNDGSDRELKALIEKEGKGQSEVVYYLGHRYLAQGEVRRAVELFELDVRHHPRLAGSWSALASAHRAAGDLERARACLEKAIELARETNAPRLREYEAAYEGLAGEPEARP